MTDVPEIAPLASWADLAQSAHPLQWDWPGWLPRGFITMLAGEPGVGKSLLLLRLAGCYICGWPWPDRAPCTSRGRVLWCEAEGAQSLNLARAQEWHVPLDGLITPSRDPLHAFSLRSEQDCNALATIARRDDVAVVFIDSLSGALGGHAENSSSNLAIMAWLAELARDTGKPVLVTHHLRKARSAGATLDLDRVRGSTALYQVTRMVWGLQEVQARGQRWPVLSVLKDNLAQPPQPLVLKPVGGPAPRQQGQQLTAAMRLEPPASLAGARATGSRPSPWLALALIFSVLLTGRAPRVSAGRR